MYRTIQFLFWMKKLWYTWKTLDGRGHFESSLGIEPLLRTSLYGGHYVRGKPSNFDKLLQNIKVVLYILSTTYSVRLLITWFLFFWVIFLLVVSLRVLLVAWISHKFLSIFHSFVAKSRSKEMRFTGYATIIKKENKRNVHFLKIAWLILMYLINVWLVGMTLVCNFGGN